MTNSEIEYLLKHNREFMEERQRLMDEKNKEYEAEMLKKQNATKQPKPVIYK